MPIHAHGATLDVTPAEVIITRSLLARSLGAAAVESVQLTDIDAADVTAPTAVSFGTLTLRRASGDIALRFAPGSDPSQVQTLIDAARRGEVPTTGTAVAGLDFVALDVETANDGWGSICQVGVARFRDGLETESRAWLCTPPPGLGHFLDVNIGIHGITPDDVADAPGFADILPDIVDFVGADVMVAHNAQFDSTALREAARAAGVQVPELRVACSLALARDASRAGRIDVANHKLPTVVAAVGAPEFRHHDAAEDARAAGHIISGLAHAFGFAGSIDELFAERGFVLGSVAPEAVMPVLRQRTAPLGAADRGAGTDFRDAAPQGSSAQPGLWDDTAPPAAHPAAAPSRSRSSRGPAPWAAVATPDTIPDPNPNADPAGPLFGQNVTLTGDFEPFDKGTLWQGIAERGGQVGKSVTKKTTILVLGTWATKTSKEKRAEELIAKGQKIDMWPHDRLLAALGLDAAPPF